MRCFYRGRLYDSITEAKVSVFLQELSRAFGGDTVAVDVKPGEVNVSAALAMLRARVGHTRYVPESLENARWFPDFGLYLHGVNYWVEVKYHASRMPIGEYEKYHVVSLVDRPVLLIEVDSGCILPPFSTGKREYGAVAQHNPGASSSGITITRFFGGRRCDVVFTEPRDGFLQLEVCPEDLRDIRALKWGTAALSAAYHTANGVQRVQTMTPEQDSVHVHPNSLCVPA